MDRIWMFAGALAGLSGVGMAAYAAHGVTPGTPQAAVVGSGVQMHLVHALALLGCAFWAVRGGWPTQAAGLCFVVGLLLFCGAAYVSGIGGVRLGPVAPIGGTTLMLGWAFLAWAALRG
jgi:uncharacterized membrane protein YgdD (TMEM256/DUF423 family)